MNTKKIVLSGSLVLVAALSVGFNCPCPMAAAEAAMAKPTPLAQKKVDAKAIEHTSLRAPAIVTLEKGETNSAGETQFFAHVDVRDMINYPVSVEIKVGKGTELLGSLASTPLDLGRGAGTRVTHAFVVKGPVSDQNPVRVHVGGQSQNAVVGFYADRQYPAAPVLAIAAPEGVRPPTGRPPVAKPAIGTVVLPHGN